ncbi:MAG: hypothetical protein V8Q82_05590 [Christensenellales bacterium]
MARMLMPTAQGKPITAAMRSPVMLSRETYSPVAARHAGRYRGHQIGAHGHGQGGGHVNQRQHHARIQAVAHQRLGGIHAAAFHEVGQHKAVDPPCQGHDARAKSDGDGDGSQADGDALAGKHGRAFILRNLGEGTAAEQVLDSHVQQGCALGNGGAQQRPRCAQRGPARAHAPDGHGQGDAYLAYLLDQLRDGRGQHDAVPLHIAAEGAHDAHKQKAGRDG